MQSQHSHKPIQLVLFIALVLPPHSPPHWDQREWCVCVREFPGRDEPAGESPPERPPQVQTLQPGQCWWDLLLQEAHQHQQGTEACVCICAEECVPVFVCWFAFWFCFLLEMFFILLDLCLSVRSILEFHFCCGERVREVIALGQWMVTCIVCEVDGWAQIPLYVGTYVAFSHLVSLWCWNFFWVSTSDWSKFLLLPHDLSFKVPFLLYKTLMFVFF